MIAIQQPQPATVQVRSAQPADTEALFGLIQALAAYEKLSDSVTGSAELLRSHLFGDRPFAEALVAEARPIDGDEATLGEATLVGLALFFYNYSTFLTKPGIYLEDLFVLPAYRGQGVGKALLQGTIERGRAQHCGRVEWSVLDWNAPAIAFYEHMGADVLPDWRICRVVLEG